ncbi:MAG: hypothetical protein ABSB15_05950 [Bryobacteraceae bacterium]
MKAAQRLLVAFALMAGSLAAQGNTEVTLVAPGPNQVSAGNASSNLSTTPVSLEVQELLGSGILPGSPIVITGFSFRAAPGAGPVSATIGNLNVYLSTSPNFPNSFTPAQAMSPTFANNVGQDKTLVYSGSDVSWSDAGCTAPGPCPFDINIVFSTPFYYSSKNGSLLIDMFETNLSATSGATDAESYAAPGGGVGQVVGTPGAAMGTFSYQGNIVQLTYLGSPAAGHPGITGIVNPASNIPPGLPNSGIAQGSLFVVYGNNLASAGLLQATTLPLPNSLGVTSIAVTVNGTTVSAPIDYTYGGALDQVAAVLPSNTPVGGGTLTLTFNGGLRANYPITVVASNFGISTVNESGSGAAVVTFANYSVVSPTNSAKPGDNLVLWGTGLGPLPAGQSDASGAVGGNLPTTLEVFVGGVPATILYQGRTPTAVGLDQINFTVPLTAPLGCNVGIVVQTTAPTATVSNGPTIALASTDGAPCSDPTQYVPESYLSKSSTQTVYVGVKQTNSLNGFTGAGNNPSVNSNFKASAGFFQFTQAQLATATSSLNTEPTLGSCLTGTVAGSGSGGGLPVATYLNGGASVTLTPPSGAPIVLPSQSSGSELIYQSTNLIAVPSGTWGFSDGMGATGANSVGPVSFNFPVPASINWTNETNLASGVPIDRTQPLTITWTGGDSNGYVDIQTTGQVGLSGSPAYTSYFDCSAPTSAGSFTIPPSILASMPTGLNAQAGIQVSTYSFPLTLPAVAGFDAGINSSELQNNIPVIFK